MRLLRELMLGLGDDGVLGAAFGDNSPLSGQDNISPLACGCAACAGKIDYQPTLTQSGRFTSTFSSLWTFQAEGESPWQMQTPNDGPQEVNESGGDIIPGGVDTTYTLTLGQTETGRINTDGDRDWFAVTLVAGQSYEFTLVGSGGDPLNDPYLELRNEFGAIQHLDDDGGPGISSRLLFTALTSGTYYINARAYDNPGVDDGDYTITFNTGAPQNPLDTLNIGYVFPDLTINVYFTTTGEINSGDTALRNWTQAEINSVMSALASISAVTPLVFTQVFSSVGSDFRLSIADLGTNVLGHFFVGAGNGAFDPDGAGWNSAGMNPGSLGYATIVHEILHGLGLAHPHMDGGDVQVLQGVTSEFNAFGTFLMGQGVFTMMSYNDGWQSPFGVTPSVTTGVQGGPMALDIAYLQQLYGSVARNTGDNVYSLTAANGTYLSIWDTGGVDTIQFAAGAQNAVIDLRPASLTTAFGGGGWVSYVHGFHAGWTIANGVVIENATGASGNDTLTGNDVANILTGNNGADTLIGNGGDDTLNGGAGIDSMSGGQGSDTYHVDSASDSVVEAASEGIDTVLASTSYALTDNVENLTITGTGAFSATGNSLNNIIIGNSGANFINGGVGADTMQGGAGDDNYFVDNVGDGVVENASEGTDRVFSTISFVLGANIENLTLQGTDSLNGTGNELANAITGNDGNNLLTGNGGADTLDGGEGDDTLNGGTGADALIGGNGTDTATYWNASAGVVANLATGGAGGDAAGDTYDGIERLEGSGFDDTLTGNASANRLLGGAGNDTLDGAAGGDLMIGNGGDDTYFVDNINDGTFEGQVGLTGGNDTVRAVIGWTIATNVENLVLLGTADWGVGNTLANSLTGNAVNNQLYGLEGDDSIDGGAGADLMIGHQGNDTYYVDNAGDNPYEGNAAWGTDTVVASIGWTLGVNLENLLLTGTAGNFGTGNSLNNTITGNSGNNQLYGLEGDDTLIGGAGADLMIGHQGNDTYYVDNAGDNPYEGNPAWGIDTVVASLGWTLGANLENLTLQDAAGGTFATGNSLDNTIIGNASNNQLYGLEGNDTLNGGAGADLMIGYTGNDTYYVDNASDNPYEGNAAWGIDTVISSLGWTLVANLENLTLAEAAGATFGTGNSLDNVITGNSTNNQLYGLDGNDVLDGGGGADQMIGHGGNDTYIVDNVGDTVFEGLSGAPGGTDEVRSSINYTLGANVENLVLTGTATTGVGNALNNRITGNASANTLTGDAGADTFVFASALGGSNIDALSDFNVADDTIELSTVIFTGIGLGALAANAFVIGSAAVDGDDRIIYNAATGALYYDADGDGAGAAIQIATLATGLALTENDFLGGP